ncbi:MAG: glycine/D-amino acid oxidase-like deaminating enzyme [Oceanospirillaceae bacterium]|jgi:glycine/D-amino acid oxidase-like deaminating enzyme
MTQFTPYWWQDQPQYRNTEVLPAKADCVVVGAGFTGLSAALTLAQAGRHVIVLDSEAIGFGASTRNGGMLGSGHKVSVDDAKKYYGPDIAAQLHCEANASLAFTKSLILNHNIDCELQDCGRLRTAWTPQDFTAMAGANEGLQCIEPFSARMVKPDEMPQHIDTPLYFGGLLYESHACVQPRKLHYGLLQLALQAGVQVFGEQPVHAVNSEPDGFSISTHSRETQHQEIHCQQVLMATNGYTQAKVSSFLAKRIMPVPSFVIVTEELGEDLVQALLPGGHCMVETRQRFCYYRATPCGKHIMLGSRAALHAITPQQALPTLRAKLTEIFPSLKDTKISHCWTGFTGFSFSKLPNIGCHDGIYHALGYCGNGVAMAPYLGHKAALKMLNPQQQHSVFEQTPLQNRIYHHGNPWYMPAASAWYRTRDWWDNWKRIKALRQQK